MCLVAASSLFLSSSLRSSLLTPKASSPHSFYLLPHAFRFPPHAFRLWREPTDGRTYLYYDTFPLHTWNSVNCQKKKHFFPILYCFHFQFHIFFSHFTTISALPYRGYVVICSAVVVGYGSTGQLSEWDWDITLFFMTFINSFTFICCFVSLFRFILFSTSQWLILLVWLHFSFTFYLFIFFGHVINNGHF